MKQGLQTARQGVVFLVGAGPGDPGLITLRGLHVIETADIIYYDNLATPALLAHAPEDAETIYVGRKRTEHAYSQAEIHRMLIDSAQAGKRVVRLKGGDPLIFGRGGEEIEALAEAGVRFEIIPGVTSAVGVGAYAGIPLTHRDWTSAVTFVTGHDVDAVDWSKIGAAETLVVFMGLMNFGRIACNLIKHGRSPATPAAAIRWGTRGDQTVVEGTVKTLAAEIESTHLKPPALIIVGEVVGLRSKLDWFGALPLFGTRIVVTRARKQSGPFCVSLRTLGADAVELPTIHTRPVSDGGLINGAITNLADYDWLIFTSANAVKYFIEWLDKSDFDLRNLRARILAIGSVTANAVHSLHLKVDFLPDQFLAEGVLETLASSDLNGKRVLLPRATQARDLLPCELEKRGAKVDVVPVYCTELPESSRTIASQVFGGTKRPDWITFTSSSTVKNFAAMVPKEYLEGVKIASIGPVTSATIRAIGLQVHVEAREYTTDGLLKVLVEEVKRLSLDSGDRSVLGEN